MSWWGKLVGGAVGFAVGGPIGALVGAAIGHNVDRSGSGPVELGAPDQRERIQSAFFVATFTVMGHLAKADGRVSQAEIAAANQVMDRLGLPPQMRAAARDLFRQGKAPTFPLEQVIEQLADECGQRRDLARLFVEIQVHAALADGEMNPAERLLIERIGARLGVRQAELDQIESLARGARPGAGDRAGRGRGLDDAYAALGVSRANSDDEIKRAYRRLMSQHHPDKLLAQGLPEEMVRAATERTQEIQAAYETVHSSRAR